MKLFLDTTSNYFIISLIDEDNNVIDFNKIESNNDNMKNSNFYLQNFLKKNNIKLKFINDFLFSTGPGSFTGLKIPYIIFNSILIVNKDIKIYWIKSYELLRQDKKLIPAIKFSKNNYYVFNKILFFNKIKVLNKSEINDNYYTYDNFKQEDLKNKLDYFKLSKNPENINLLFLNKFKKNRKWR